MSGHVRDEILIPKSLRLEWMDVMAVDEKLSHAAFRAAAVIGSHLNKYSGNAYPSLPTIAKGMGASERTAWTAVKELETKGYLVVVRRSLGEGVRATRKGPVIVRHAGGKGVSNLYVPAFERSKIFTSPTTSKLATRCEQYWAQRSQKAVTKLARGFQPTLSSPSGKNPSPPKQTLDAAGELLRELIGEEELASWFSRVRVLELKDGVLTLEVPTTFFRSEISRRFLPQIRIAWDVQAVAFVVAQQKSPRGPYQSAEIRYPR